MSGKFSLPLTRPSPPRGERIKVRGAVIYGSLFLALAILATPLSATAQQPANIPRIGILGNAPSRLWEAFERRNRVRIAELAAKARVPAIYGAWENVEAGGLMSYATNLLDVWQRAAVYVDKILKGTKPADLPVEQPTKFELVINLKTAKALGLTLPRSLLLRADQVIQ